MLPDGGSVLLEVPLTTLEALYQQHLVDEDYLDKVCIRGGGERKGGVLGGLRGREKRGVLGTCVSVIRFEYAPTTAASRNPSRIHTG